MPATQHIHPGDEIICPRDGKPERVVISKRMGNFDWFIRTNRHDHRHPIDRFIRLVEEES
jgi:hypothetical protein